MKTYKDWAKDEAYVQDVSPESAKLLWIGKKETRRVILYVHGKTLGYWSVIADSRMAGGAFIIPAIAGALPFWSYIKGKVTQRLGRDELGIAVFTYSSY